ncbi:MAG: ABC transporter permease [Firmicutes bacterium]|nr:ABC transporter permease [Bacillota bacterium]
MNPSIALEERSSTNQAWDVWRRFRRNKLALVGGIVVLLIILAAVFAPYVATHSYSRQNLRARLSAPSSEHLLGTDGYGRDVFSRVVWGARVSLQIGFGAAGLAVLIGVFLGSIAGYYGGFIDSVIMRFVDIMMCIPALFLTLTIIALFGASMTNTMLVIGLIYWTRTCRIVRGEFLSLRNRQFTEAARAIGLSDARIIFRHLLPNALAPIIVQTTLFIAQAILIESGLSFLGLGAQPPTPSWGNMLNEGYKFLSMAWWIATFPGVAIFLTVLSFNLLGDGLRDALDPMED